MRTWIMSTFAVLTAVFGFAETSEESQDVVADESVATVSEDSFQKCHGCGCGKTKK